MRAQPADAAPAGAEAAPEPRLRARKKEQTRREPRENAARLFASRGFAGMTIADIAAATNVWERTFFRCFDSKDALLLPDGVEPFTRTEAEPAARPDGEEPREAVCAALPAAAKPFSATGLTALTHPLEGTESLVVRRPVQAFTGFEERPAALVEKRLPPHTPDSDLHATVVACTALSAVRAVLRTQRNRRRAGTARPTAGELLPRALAILSRIGSPAS